MSSDVRAGYYDRLAKMSLAEFIARMKDHGMLIVNFTEEKLDQEMAHPNF